MNRIGEGIGNAHMREPDGDLTGVRDSAGWHPPAAYWLLSLWFALFSGLAEVLILILQQNVWHQPIKLGPDIVWMIPAANIVIMSVPGIAFAQATRRWPTRVLPRQALFVYTFLSMFGLLSMIPKLHVLATSVLAVGVALQLSRLMTTHSEGFLTLVRATMGRLPSFNVTSRQAALPKSSESSRQHGPISRRRFVLQALGAVAGLGIGGRGLRTLSEKRDYARLGTTTAAMPNVLLIVLDTVRASNLSLDGYERSTTPRLERIARGGVYFERAFSTAPWTLPAHGSLFTGRFPHELSTDFETGLDKTYPTLAEVLSAVGYITAGFVANTEYCSYEFGLDRGFVHYEDYNVSVGEIIRSSSLARMSVHSKLRQMVNHRDLLGRKGAAQINGDFMHWLNQQDARRPFFAFLNYFDAHDPYYPPDEFALRFSSKVPRGHLPPLGTKLALDEVRELRNAYDGAIAYLDDQVGTLLDRLQDKGILQDTLVIITSDHGEQFGEHGLLGHANSLYMPLLHVPLLFLVPGSSFTNLRISAPVSLRDVSATIFEILGLKEMNGIPGRSLTQYWQGSGAKSEMVKPLLAEATAGIRQPETYPTAKGKLSSLLFHEMHYIQHSDGFEELYDLEKDPGELRNLAVQRAYWQITNQLRSLLELTLN